MNTVLHVPLNKNLKFKAESIAKEKGYSSLQEVLRVFIVQFTNEELKPTFINTDKILQLTSGQEAHLSKRVQETQKATSGGKSYTVKSVNEMMEILEK